MIRPRGDAHWGEFRVPCGALYPYAAFGTLLENLQDRQTSNSRGAQVDRIDGPPLLG